MGSPPRVTLMLLIGMAVGIISIAVLLVFIFGGRTDIKK